MNKFLYILIVVSSSLSAQSPEIEWQNTYIKSEFCGAKIRDMVSTSDGGSIGVGDSCSDYYIVKIDANGNKEWDITLGGTGTDIAESVEQTLDGGYIINGRTSSPNDGNVQGGHGGVDFWVVKLSSTGSFVWGKCLGGYYDDFGFDIIQTADGNYVALGYLYPTSQTTTGYGGADYWLVKLNANGNIIWQSTYGGNGDDKPNKFSQTSDGGFIMTGISLSSSGQVTGNNGEYDAWIIKIDQDGILDWQRNIGGTDIDVINMVKETSDGNYILSGATLSNNGDVSGNHGEYDIWVVKMDSSGTILWQKCIGGSMRDYSTGVLETTNGDFIIGGYTNSTDGDVNNNFGLYDFFIVKLDTSGTIIWTKNIGAPQGEYIQSTHFSSDNGLILAGDRYTNSPLGFVGLVCKLYPENLSVVESSTNTILLYPNPSNDELNISLNSDDYRINSITVVDVFGKIIFSSAGNLSKLNISNYSSGIYYIKLVTDSETFQAKFVKG